jgi:glutamate-1-semialdehyde 2,1-aminomutase
MENLYNNKGFTFIDNKKSAIPKDRVINLLKREKKKYIEKYKESAVLHSRAVEKLPLGVSSSFQYYNPYPLYVQYGEGAYLREVGGTKLLDLSMGFGSLLFGHNNKELNGILDNCKRKNSVLFVMPTDSVIEGAERLAKRFKLDKVRFTNSGTESLMYAVRVAKSYSGKKYILKVEGGYHGGYDPLLASVKPNINEVGSNEEPNVILPGYAEDQLVKVIPYNDPEVAESVIRKYRDKIACLVIEPVMENIGIVLPDNEYLSKMRDLCDKYNIILIFDEVKTGLTAGFGGAKSVYNIEPDLITLGKSIGGGYSIAAYGGKNIYMSEIENRKSEHFGTYNGNPLAIDALIAVDNIATEENLNRCYQNNYLLACNIYSIIKDYYLPAYVTGIGAKGSIVWRDREVKNYRDYKEIVFSLAELQFIYYLNNEIVTPPGLDEQWLISMSHGINEINYITNVFLNLAKELRS